tara:strand:+ start:521 stop:835 length:315 start_codon:yes stop_codon:yes gene_type:complete
MKLLTKAIKNKATKQYPMGADMEQMVVAKFFNPCGRGTWYLMNMDGDYCWGICHIYEWEIGSFSIGELEGVSMPFGLKIERDLYFKPVKASELWTKLNKERVIK